jgi:hypothetical protein
MRKLGELGQLNEGQTATAPEAADSRAEPAGLLVYGKVSGGNGTLHSADPIAASCDLTQP